MAPKTKWVLETKRDRLKLILAMVPHVGGAGQNQKVMVYNLDRAPSRSLAKTALKQTPVYEKNWFVIGGITGNEKYRDMTLL